MHDQNFKNLILDYPKEALAFFAASETTAADLQHAKITPIRQEQLQERLGARFRELDAPLLVEWPNGERAAILFLIEEETQTQRFSIYRLAHYCLDVAELMQTTRVIPVVIFLNQGSRPEVLRLGGDRHGYLDFHYLACDLKRMSARDYQDSDNIVARLNLPNMQYPRQDKLRIYAAAQAGLVGIEANPNKVRKYIDFIDYYADLNEQEILEYKQRYLNEEGEAMGLVQSLIQEGHQKGHQEGLFEGQQKGRQEGRQEGLQEGRKEECMALLTKQLRRKFGLQPELEQALKQLPTLSLATLEHLAEEMLDWREVSELIGWLQKQ